MVWFKDEFGCEEGRGFAAARGKFELSEDGLSLKAVGGNGKT